MPSARKSILVVDDDPGMADTPTGILQAGEYEVATAHSGDVAVRMLRSGFPVLPKPLDLQRVLALATSATA
jgi:CheY-like chemotaxis protein